MSVNWPRKICKFVEIVSNNQRTKMCPKMLRIKRFYIKFVEIKNRIFISAKSQTAASFFSNCNGTQIK